MSLLVACPVYAQAMMPFVESLMALQESLIKAEIDHEFLFIKNESLVQRARNNAVLAFLEADFMASGFERLIFIDADIEFTPTDVEKLWNLDTDVACASYPMKKMMALVDHPLYEEVAKVVGVSLAKKLVYAGNTTAWKNGVLVNLDDLDGPVEVDYAGTGFLMIKRKVFEDMREYFPERSHMEGNSHHEVRESFAWFDPRVSDGPEDKVYLSEDYAFAEDFRKMGGKIILEPSIRLKHYGIFGFGE